MAKQDLQTTESERVQVTSDAAALVEHTGSKTRHGDLHGVPGRIRHDVRATVISLAVAARPVDDRPRNPTGESPFRSAAAALSDWFAGFEMTAGDGQLPMRASPNYAPRSRNGPHHSTTPIHRPRRVTTSR
jgi:hypothetical protein